MVRCKRAYLRGAAVCVGALYLIYIFGMLEKTSRIVRTDAKDLNGTSNTSLHICPMFSPYLKGLRKLNLDSCVMDECKIGDKLRNIALENCNMGYCSNLDCKIASCSGEIGSPSVTYTNQSKHNITECEETDISFSGHHHALLGQFGGHWKPSHCQPLRRIAIIIPFRDRHENLCVLLKNLIPVLTAQLNEFRIFVVEQVDESSFNKGRLMNIGFLEATKMFNFDCVIFHDVDLLPENDQNIYQCTDQPRHLSVAVDTHNYKLMYQYLVGGVLAFRPRHFRLVNGYSNEFWGWGGEDDDMAVRIVYSGLKITRPSAETARYTMANHTRSKKWAKRYILLRKSKERMRTDGLKNVPYHIVSVQLYTFYTKFEVLFNRSKY